MSVKKEMVNGVINEAMGLERRVMLITGALEMLRKVHGSIDVDVCIPVLERACDKLNQEIADLFHRYVGEEVKK